MKIEPTSEIDKAIAEAWPDAWKAANTPTHGKSGWSSNAKRRNRLRRRWAQQCYETRAQ